jgi:hypothetical protein
VHEPQEAGAVGELGTADAAIDVDVLIEDSPRFTRGVRAPLLNWPRNGALLVAEAGLVLLLRA